VSESTNHVKVMIMGSGPAGLTAAIYAARADLEPLIVEGGQPGGQLTITTEVENYPGFEEGIMGPELMDVTHRQAERFGTRFIYGAITEVDFTSRPFKIDVEGKVYLADTFIIASGASARLLGVKGESELMGYGVSACATCDGAFFREQDVAVIGGGDSALEEANFLTRFAKSVTIVHRRDALRGSQIMQNRVLANPKIKVAWDSIVDEMVGTRESGLTAVRLKNAKSGELSDLVVTGCFVAVGHDPNTSLFKGKLSTDDKGYLITKPFTGTGAIPATATDVPGVFACGDVQDSHYRQAISAAGSGCMAAIDAEHFLAEQEA
jgi:thioredoxin reductase (NADPH)